jgi:hypothetical protein
MQLHKAKKLLYSKGNSYQTKGAAHRMEENASDKGLITRIYGKLKKLNSERINDPMKKRANELNRAFSKEEVQIAKKYEEMLNIPVHKRNINQNHAKIPPHSC